MLSIRSLFCELINEEKKPSIPCRHALSLPHLREASKKRQNNPNFAWPTYSPQQSSNLLLRSVSLRPFTGPAPFRTCFLSDPRPLFLFLSSLLRSPGPSVAIFKMRAGEKGVGWGVDTGQGGTGEEMGNR